MRLLVNTVAVVLLAVIPAHAVEPFSWALYVPSSGVIPSPGSLTVTIPEGMAWRVTQVSGVSTSGAPVFSVGQSRPIGPSGVLDVLYITPQLVVEKSNGDLWAISYTTQVNVVFQGTLTARREPNFDGDAATFALNGYLTPSLSGDYNGDGIVDAADYTVIRDKPLYWGQSDYVAFATSYGTIASTAASIPEPSSLVMLSVLMATTRLKQRL
jgi:hypothetical protein